MKTASTESGEKVAFSFQERVIVRPSSTSALKSSETVRLESLAQWKGDGWIHPFSNVDISLSSGFNDHKNKISRVQMSISSHYSQQFPTSSDGLDHIPVLPLWEDDHDDSNCTESSIYNSERYLSIPQGFFLSVRTVHGLTLEEEARAVQSVFQELIRIRLLTTPVTGGEWDIIEHKDSKSELISSSRLYQLILPFDGAAWSSDALTQCFRRTLPEVCGNSSYEKKRDGNERFFGWSAFQWSNFLVGYKDGGGEQGKGEQQPLQYLTYNKKMWWTWTSSSLMSNTIDMNDQSFSFGIQYQQTIPADAKELSSDNFLNKKLKCHIGKRNAFEVLPTSTPNLAKDYQLVRISRKNEETKTKETSAPIQSNFSYSVGIEQVLRRHHANHGRFESTVQLRPFFELESGNLPSCRMEYRQMLPSFLVPTWRSLRIVNEDNDDVDAVGDFFYSNSVGLQASVEWNPEDQSSILTVEATPIQKSSISSPSESLLPSTIYIGFEYSPSFLTIDDFPGDPNRGRVIPPARVAVQCSPSTASKVGSTTTLTYSNSLLLLPPVPDLSMPFNVISVTSSLYAYIIGAMVTILVRKGSEKIKYELYPDKKPKSKLTKFKERLREKVGLGMTRLFGKEYGRGSQRDITDESIVATHVKSE
mmetsp:Transcript_13463/g.31681  ORF Transcript_13463/g.31681 Transcript_13463/m.31681 type:complete len:646 (+) Transcript_13463:69-2006(+)|eukprot:CAMPEP_0197181100 /NCGR_PEP_ID=MMETSP1423-20130617/5481_1 /TAXON_ID=476441 /ORGANISM="Pseudo-nitzschia heimii, Strain UNC1101" /LENGTH=645 /DNA_ID=CAMNT_0042631279 /DNA_START=17 /DNA_END=1954 /DNA_ORIENTATION=+